jgi:hypothetical protein
MQKAIEEVSLRQQDVCISFTFIEYVGAIFSTGNFGSTENLLICSFVGLGRAVLTAANTES